MAISVRKKTNEREWRCKIWSRNQPHMFAKSNTQAELPQDFWNCILIKLTLSFNSINFYTWSIGRGGRMLQKRANYMFLNFVSLRGLVKIIWNLKLENEVNDKHVLFSSKLFLQIIQMIWITNSTCSIWWTFSFCKALYMIVLHSLMLLNCGFNLNFFLVILGKSSSSLGVILSNKALMIDEGVRHFLYFCREYNKKIGLQWKYGLEYKKVRTGLAPPSCGISLRPSAVLCLLALYTRNQMFQNSCHLYGDLMEPMTFSSRRDYLGTKINLSITAKW